MLSIFKKKEIELKERKKEGNPIEFEDINLEVYLRKLTGIKEGTLYEDDLAGIKKLDFKGWPLISIRGIQYVCDLEELNLYQSKMNNLSFLKKLVKLKKLDLSWSDSISEIESLSGLTDMEDLRISYSSGLKNFYPINNMKKLKILDLSENFLYDNTFMSSIDWIEEINLSKNNLTEYKVEKENLKLRSLDISANHLSNIEFLRKIPDLIHLDISVNKITDLEPLLCLTKLEYLDMRGNKIDFSNKRNKDVLLFLKDIKCKIKK